MSDETLEKPIHKHAGASLADKEQTEDSIGLMHEGVANAGTVAEMTHHASELSSTLRTAAEAIGEHAEAASEIAAATTIAGETTKAAEVVGEAGAGLKYAGYALKGLKVAGEKAPLVGAVIGGFEVAEAYEKRDGHQAVDKATRAVVATGIAFGTGALISAATEGAIAGTVFGGPVGTAAGAAIAVGVVATAYVAEQVIAPAAAKAADYVAGDAVDRVFKSDDVRHVAHQILGATDVTVIKNTLEAVHKGTELAGKGIEKIEHAASAVGQGITHVLQNEGVQKAEHVAGQIIAATPVGAVAVAAMHGVTHVVHSETVHKAEHLAGAAAKTVAHGVEHVMQSQPAQMVEHAAGAVGHVGMDVAKTGLKGIGDGLKWGAEHAASGVIGTAKMIEKVENLHVKDTVSNLFHNPFGGHTADPEPPKTEAHAAPAPAPAHSEAAHATAPSAHTDAAKNDKYAAMLKAGGFEKPAEKLEHKDHDHTAVIAAQQVGNKAPQAEAAGRA